MHIHEGKDLVLRESYSSEDNWKSDVNTQIKAPDIRREYVG